ncbi:hypothetical protein ACIP93_37440 [Streptomyces sp. NPDC088745]|uniref:hypothetical protein n=1 Tax=Streptomyces sp. NPDC088745 TaxID=3365884 RepID=UPI00381FCA29
MDTDEPGEGEPGSLETWSRSASLGAPVYRAPASADDLDRELGRYTPEGGIGLLDTPAWERKPETIHLRALTLVDLAVLCLQPSPGELDRAGSFLKALDSIQAVGGRVPSWVILLTRTHHTASAPAETREVLEEVGYTVLRSQVPDEHSRSGLGQSHGKPIPVNHSGPMGRLAAELFSAVTA